MRSSGETQTTIDEFREAVAAKIRAGIPKLDAVRAVARQNPSLYRRFLVEVCSEEPTVIHPRTTWRETE